MFRESENLERYFINSKIEVRESSIHGLGIFALQTIQPKEIIEISPVVMCSGDTFDTLKRIYGERHVFHDYCFKCKDIGYGFPLGYGGLYNHSWEPNAFWKLNESGPRLIFRAIKEIEPGTEICIKYNPNSNDLWFDDGLDWHYDSSSRASFGHQLAKEMADLKDAHKAIDNDEGAAKKWMNDKK